MLTLLLSLFGCRHLRVTWPQTPVNRLRHPVGDPYSVCLDCGREFAWSIDSGMGPEIRRETVAGPAMEAINE